MFGAKRGRKWPALAIRRFILYTVFLHELGHLQIIDRDARTERRKYAMETKAQKFAVDGRARLLWSERFDHPDPVHNPPSAVELAASDPTLGVLTKCRPPSEIRPAQPTLLD
jgi:hypothetical protein